MVGRAGGGKSFTIGSAIYTQNTDRQTHTDTEQQHGPHYAQRRMHKEHSWSQLMTILQLSKLKLMQGMI